VKHWTTVAVGSIPAGADPVDFQTDTETALRSVGDAQLDAAEPPFVVAWRELAEGRELTQATPDESVTKAQLVGPITLLAGQFTPLKQTFRGTSAAIGRLLDRYPNLEEVWLDEPLLSSEHAEQLPLLPKCLSALQAEFFGLTFGIHCCNQAPWTDLLAIDAFDVLHVDIWNYGDEVIEALSDPRAIPRELVLGVVPSRGKLPALQDLQAAVERVQAEAPDDWQIHRISTSCGLGAESTDDGLRRMKQLHRLRDALNK
jgi:hypothetical protein